jgi:hypothetical protein
MSKQTLSPSTQSSAQPLRGVEIAQSIYQADHQIKLLSLHADAAALMQQLQSSQRPINPPIDPAQN